VIPTTQPNDYPEIDPQEAVDTYDQATAAARHSPLSRLWLHSPTGRKIARTLDLIPVLATQVSRLRDRLARAVSDLGNLTAAGRATLGAQRDGEHDPLYYLRDELHAQGQLPPGEPDEPGQPDERERP
jgi:hypothetical protein